jgi:hypothetical protein
VNQFPKAALAQHIAVLGKTGSGKSYAVRGIVEGLLDENARVCIIDPTGAWNGLRSSATGKSGGYPVVIFGGSHADLTLAGQYGEAIAETIGTSSTPAIIDTSLMRVGERTRFMADFADALIRKNKGPLHLVIDEAHLFAPQGKVNSPQAGEMLSATNNLVSLGRSRGLRIIMITQRPAKLHKDSLTQCETLVALRLIAPQDRNAVREWIEDNADKAKGNEIISSLASLKTGQGWVWAPELGILDRISFPKIRTFDTGRAPDGSEQHGQVLAPIDKEAISAKLQAVKADALANDPSALKAKIAELQRQIKTTLAAAPVDTAALEKSRFEEGFRLGQESITDQLEVFYGSLESWSRNMPPAPAFKTQMAGVPVRLERHRPSPPKVAPRAKTNGHAPATDLPKGEVAVLSACIQYPDGLRREQITVLTGFKRSTRDAYIYRLKEKSLVDVNGETVTATEDGVLALPDAEPLPRGAELQQFWLDKLPQGERLILENLIDVYPKALARDEVTQRTGFKRSTRDAYIYRMASKQIVTEPSRGEVRASEELFA